MRQYPLFLAGLLARGVSVVATIYADWLMQKITDGTDAGMDFWQDLRRFCRWLVRVLSERWCGGSGRHAGYEEQWQSAMYGAS
jgi:hypothetical protein